MKSRTVLLSTARLHANEFGGRQRQLVLLADRLRDEGVNVVLFSSERRVTDIGVYRPHSESLRGLSITRAGHLSSLLFSLYLKFESAKKRSQRLRGKKTVRYFLLHNLTRLTAGFGRGINSIVAKGQPEDAMVLRALRKEPKLVFQSLQMAEAMRKVRPDFAVAFGTGTSLPMLVAASSFGIPTIVSERVGGFANRHKLEEASSINLYQRAALLTANNQKVVEELKLAFPDKPVTYIRNIAESAQLVARPNLRLTGCVVARLIKRKRIEQVILAIKELSEQGIAIFLTIFGDGPERSQLEKLIHDLGVKHQIMFVGWKKGSEIPFGNYFFSFSNGKDEGSSNSLEQAILAGCIPIVSQDPRYSSDLSGLGLCDALVSDGTAKQIQKRVRDLLEDKSLLSSVEENLKVVREGILEGSKLAIRQYLEFFEQNTRQG